MGDQTEPLSWEEGRFAMEEPSKKTLEQRSSKNPKLK